MTTLTEQLSQALKSATPGNVKLDGHCLTAPNPDPDTSGDCVNVCIADCSDDILTDEQAKANAKLLSLLRNNAGFLIASLQIAQSLAEETRNVDRLIGQSQALVTMMDGEAYKTSYRSKI